MTLAVLVTAVLAVFPAQAGRQQGPRRSGNAGPGRAVSARPLRSRNPDRPPRRSPSGMASGPVGHNEPSVRAGTRSGGGTGATAPSGVSAGHGPSTGLATSGQGGEDPQAAKWKPVVGSRFVTRGEVHVGDPVEIRVTVVHDPKVSVNLPAVLSLGEGIDVLGQGQKSSETLDDGKVREEFWIKLVCFKVGDVVPKDVEVTYTYPGPGGGGMATVRTNPGTVKVVSVMANESNPQLKPDEGPVAVFEENRTAKYLLVALAALLLGVLGGWVGYLLYRRRHRVGPPPPPPRPAHEVAFEKLDALSKGSLLDEMRFKEFYFSVSEAIREYLGNRFGFDSLEMTTTELLDQLKPVSLVGITWEQVAEFSRDCDLVKFTKYQPDREEAESVLNRAYELVRASMVSEERPSPDGPRTTVGDVSREGENRTGDLDDESRWAPKVSQQLHETARNREQGPVQSAGRQVSERKNEADQRLGTESRKSRQEDGFDGAVPRDAETGEEERS